MTISDPHVQDLLEQYRALLPVYNQLSEIVPEKLKAFFQEAGIVVTAVLSACAYFVGQLAENDSDKFFVKNSIVAKTDPVEHAETEAEE